MRGAYFCFSGGIDLWFTDGVMGVIKHCEWGVDIYPTGSMYGIYTYIWVIFRANVGKYSIHGSYGYIYIYTNCYMPLQFVFFRV